MAVLLHSEHSAFFSIHSQSLGLLLN